MHERFKILTFCNLLSSFQYINLLGSFELRFLTFVAPISSKINWLLQFHSLIGSSAVLSRILIMHFLIPFPLSHLKFSLLLLSIMVKSSVSFSWVSSSLWSVLLIITYLGKIVITLVYKLWLISKIKIKHAKTHR